MKNKKKLLVSFFLGIALISSIVAAVTYAASSRNDAVHNKLSIPNINGEIVESFTPNEPISVGGSQTKAITIENSGTTGLLVRVMVFPEIKHPNIENERFSANIGEEILITVGTDWQYGEDGYYYYLGEVPAQGTTTSLFNEVSLADNLSTDYDGASFSIQVKSETVTSANHSYRKAWWNLDNSTPPTDSSLQAIDNVLTLLVKNL